MSRILIIDDNRDLADSLGMILRDEGYEVVLACSGGDGVKALEREFFDVILIDLRLPDMSGVQVFQTVRKQYPESRIIMMTGHRIEQLFAEVTNNGNIDVFQPPFEIGQLLEILKRGTQENIILVADDKPECAEFLSGYLAEHGIGNVLAHNATEAIEGVCSGSAEVLLLELHMPVIYGLEIYLDLKKLGHTVKTIIITCLPELDSGRAGVLESALVTGCLHKPFRPEKLLQSINQILAQ